MLKRIENRIVYIAGQTGIDTKVSQGITKAEEIKTALESARQNTKMPTVIEFIIDREENVMPIVPPGNALDDMILKL